MKLRETASANISSLGPSELRKDKMKKLSKADLTTVPLTKVVERKLAH